MKKLGKNNQILKERKTYSKVEREWGKGSQHMSKVSIACSDEGTQEISK